MEKTEQKKIIKDVLMEYYQVNLASDQSRDMISDIIVGKLHDINYKVDEPSDRKILPMGKGLFEQSIQNMDKVKQENSIDRNQQIENKRLENEVKAAKSKEKDVVTKPNKPNKPTKTIKNTNRNSFKNVKKPGRKFL